MRSGEYSILAVAQRARSQWEDWFPWLGQEIGVGISWWNVAAFLVVLLLTALCHFGLRLLVKRKVAAPLPSPKEEPEHEREARRWFDLLFEAAQAPFGILIWVYGLYIAIFVLLLSWREVPQPPLLLEGWDWIRNFAYFLILVWLLFRLIGVVDHLLRKRARRSRNNWDRILTPLVGRTLRLLLPLLAIIFGLPLFPIPAAAFPFVRDGLSVLIIVFVAAILFQAIRAMEEGILENFRIDIADNLRARKLHTQITLLKKVAMVVIGVFTLASILMVFEPLRRFGTSILASAGIAGIIVGFAAQRSLATLLAGFQIAITQPIRLDDVVIVEEEWGRIEEITLTYVVVKIWDLRRLVLPIDYFITQPFQNWTRRSAHLLGTVFLYMDYSVPVPRLREALDQILEQSSQWDGKVKVLQVTDAREQTLELRILVSAPDAGTAFGLRCEVREKMVEYIRDHYPQALPRFRAEIDRNRRSQAKIVSSNFSTD